MIIKPKIRGFVCVTSHPDGCDSHIQEQIDYVKSQGAIGNGPKNILIIGSSTGYGLATRIAGAFGCGASTIGVFYERPSLKGKPASSGWYNSIAFEKKAHAEGLYAKSINGDAFSDEIKNQTIELIKQDLQQVDLIIYSLASPRRTHPKTGEVFKSELKPIGQTFNSKSLNTDKKEIFEIAIEPAAQEDIDSTKAVMGGEDWEMWIDALDKAGVIAEGATGLAYSYIGPEVTWPIYTNGTIGKAKEDLNNSTLKIDERLKKIGGRAIVSINKAVVTQASSAIPVVPLYNSILFKVMKEKGLHEGCIEQIYRLFNSQLYNNSNLELDELGRVRIDDLEMRADVQEEVAKIWTKITTDTLDELSDFAGYQSDFLKLFGFGYENVDYELDVDPVVEF